MLLAVLTMLDSMAIDLYLPGAAHIAEDFAVSSTAVQQTLVAFFIGLALGQALYGPILDRFGRKLPVLIGIVIFIIGSIIAAIATNPQWLLLARLIQALGAAAGLVAPRAIVRDLYSPQDSARIFSYLMQVMMIMPIIAPLIGAEVIAHSSWRTTFWLLAFLGLACWLWSYLCLPESLATDDRLPFTLKSVIRSYWQQTKQFTFMLYCLAGGFLLAMLFIYLGMTPFVLHQYFNLSVTKISYVLVSSAVYAIIFSGISSYLLKRDYQPYKLMITGISLHLTIGIGLSIWSSFTTPHIWGYILLLGLTMGCLGLSFGNLTAITMQHAGEQAGVASALMGVIGYLVAAITNYFSSFVPPSYLYLPILMVICGMITSVLCLLAKNRY